MAIEQAAYGWVLTLVLMAPTAISTVSGQTSTQPSTASTAVEAPPAVEILEKLRSGIEVRAEAETWNGLLEKLRPTAAWANGDLLWVQVDAGKPKFVLDRVFGLRGSDGDTRYVFLKPGSSDEAQGAWSYEMIHSGGFTRAEIEVSDKVPIHDGGPGNYAVLKSRGPGGTLYEVGWQAGPSGTGNWIRGRRLFVLRDQRDHWYFVGEGLAELTGHAGVEGVNEVIQYAVTWTGCSLAPLEIRVKEISNCYERGEEPSLPDLTTIHEGVLRGPLLMKVELDPRPYSTMEKGDDLAKVVYRFMVWTRGFATADAGRAEDLRWTWEDELKRLNPDLSRGVVTPGQRLWLPNNEEVAAAIQRLDKCRRGESIPTTTRPT